jgi:Ca2+-binding EF-hand superfamily protein
MYCKSGKLMSVDLAKALRSVGKRLTEEQVKTLKGLADSKYGGKLSLDDFKGMVKDATKIEKSWEEIEAAFKVFESKEPGKEGHIDIAEFTHALTTLGDKLSRQEIETILEDARRMGAANNSSTIEYSKILKLIKSIV